MNWQPEGEIIRDFVGKEIRVRATNPTDFQAIGCLLSCSDSGTLVLMTEDGWQIVRYWSTISTENTIQETQGGEHE